MLKFCHPSNPARELDCWAGRLTKAAARSQSLAFYVQEERRAACEQLDVQMVALKRTRPSMAACTATALTAAHQGGAGQVWPAAPHRLLPEEGAQGMD